MVELSGLPQLPEWVPHPLVVWFVLEGIALALVGLLVREVLGPVVSGAVTAGNIVYFVGSVTALLGGLTYAGLLFLNR